ncbi:MAG: hypothetical protein Q7U37_04330 [Gallionella sp.]|nr:hypothetical protein [Gallionella sp.]
MKKIEAFSLHNTKGQSILEKDFSGNPNCTFYGPIVRYTWLLDGQQHEALRGGYWHVLPDANGFICFERNSPAQPDNCLLLDAYGKERMRLTVPWQMTGSTSPESGQPPTSFANISEPYVNPADGIKGKFGVTAWVEYAGKYYFELDYHTGQFLWCKRIMD